MQQKRYRRGSHVFALFVGRDVLNRRLSVYPTEEKTGKQMCGPQFKRRRLLPFNKDQVSLEQGVKTGKVPRLF